MSESASGEADSSTDDAGKEVSRFACPRCDKDYSEKTDLTSHMRSCCPRKLEPCPTCDKRFYSETGVKQHHSRTHNEPISHTQMECDYCGSEISVPDHMLEKQDNHFCDRDCSSSWQTDRVEKICEICGTPYEVIQFRAEESKYCSQECRVERTKQITGNERYNYRTKEYECVECGVAVERSPSMVYSEDRVFCGDECYNEHRRGGYEQYYGKNWNRKRRQALRRDQYRCVVCGDTPRDLYREPDVHHIKPIEYFKNNYSEPEWWEKGNRLRNLVTMCPSCHRKWEGIPVKPKPIRNY